MTTITTTPVTFDDCRTVTDVNDRWKELFAELDLGAHPLSNEFWHVSELCRRAYERFPAGSTVPKSDAPTRVRSALAPEPVRPTEHEDGSLTIDCAGPCGETKPVKKFPTTKTGGRLNICRACRDAAYAEAREARGA